MQVAIRCTHFEIVRYTAEKSPLAQFNRYLKNATKLFQEEERILTTWAAPVSIEEPLATKFWIVRGKRQTKRFALQPKSTYWLCNKASDDINAGWILDVRRTSRFGLGVWEMRALHIERCGHYEFFCRKLDALTHPNIFLITEYSGHSPIIIIRRALKPHSDINSRLT